MEWKKLIEQNSEDICVTISLGLHGILWGWLIFYGDSLGALAVAIVFMLLRLGF